MTDRQAGGARRRRGGAAFFLEAIKQKIEPIQTQQRNFEAEKELRAIRGRV